MNKIHLHWLVSCRDSFAVIDCISTSDALELGLITQEESNVILDEFVMHLTFYMETPGYAKEAEFHPIPKSEIVRRFRNLLTKIKP